MNFFKTNKEVVSVIMILVIVFGGLILFNLETISNMIALRGGIAEKAGDYVIINYSGGEILDLWILEDTFLNNNDSSDGVGFKDLNEDYIIVQGDAKIKRIYDKARLEDYVNYHREIHGGTYFKYKESLQ